MCLVRSICHDCKVAFKALFRYKLSSNDLDVLLCLGDLSLDKLTLLLVVLGMLWKARGMMWWVSGRTCLRCSSRAIDDEVHCLFSCAHPTLDEARDALLAAVVPL
jgi:hypothetical protein